MTLHAFEPQGRPEAVLAALLRTTLQALLKPVLSPRCSIAFQRRWLGWISRLTLPARGVAFERSQLGGVPGEWLRPRGGPPQPGTLLYLHGGAYCIGSPATHRAITGRLARLTGMRVFALDYRLAPEHPHPAALHDAVAACRALLAEGPVVIAGDSAGGGLATATALALRDGGHTLPAALLLFSPWVDLTLAHLPERPPAGETMLSLAWAAECAALYLCGGDARLPGVSPLRADLRGLPPTLIQAGTDELLHGEALRLHDALQAAGVAVRCEITARRWHVFQMHGGALRSADEALRRAAAFATEKLGSAAAAASPAPRAREHEVVILGAGMSGLCMAIQLKRAGMHDFVILEKSAGLGGTWWDNRYPGAHVDVPAPLYSFSFEPNPDWQRRFAAAPEIQAYMQHCADKYGLRSHFRFGTRIERAAFDEGTGRWQLDCQGGDGTEHFSARYFVCSTGPLSQPRWPDIPGLEHFEGARLHSARWDGQTPLQGRRVGVIGTGSTAAQLIPPLAAGSAALVVFQRTANWVLPRLDRRYRALDRALAHLPPYAAAVRAFWYAALEWGRRGFDEGTLARRGMLRTAQAHLQRQVADEALREKLRPPYPLGCKRIVYSNDFYPALAQPNVELVTAPIERITANGVRTADGREHALDLLVCATGFDVQHSLAALPIIGRGGRTLGQAWADGPQAHLGLTVAGFPNLFLMLGPNTATGHTSTLLYIEPGVQWVLSAMAEVQQRGRAWIDVRPEVMQAYNDALQSRLEPSVWSQCRSWYRDENGRVTAIFPGFTREYVRAVQGQRFESFEFG